MLPDPAKLPSKVGSRFGFVVAVEATIVGDDTSAWYALVNRRDPDHATVRTALETFSGRLVTSNFVFDETVTLCRYRLGHDPAIRVGDRLRAGTLADVVRATAADEVAAWALFHARVDKTYSFTDCDGTTSGDLLAAFSMGTTSTDVREILALRSAVADAIESGAPLTGPIEGVSSSFLNFGKDELALRAELNAEMARYTDIAIELAGAPQH